MCNSIHGPGHEKGTGNILAMRYWSHVKYLACEGLVPSDTRAGVKQGYSLP